MVDEPRLGPRPETAEEERARHARMVQMIVDAVKPTIENPHSAQGLFLIWSVEHDQWWRPGGVGYTRLLREAGLYVAQRAREIVERANIVKFHEVLVPLECVGLPRAPMAETPVERDLRRLTLLEELRQIDASDTPTPVLVPESEEDVPPTETCGAVHPAHHGYRCMKRQGHDDDWHVATVGPYGPRAPVLVRWSVTA